MKFKKELSISFILAILAGIIYFQTSGHDFIQYDDLDYIVENNNVRTGLSPENVAWAFTTFHSCNWHPLTWISHMIDVQLFGLNPAGHHLVNVLFHIANSILLFLVLRKMTAALWPSAFVAVLFAVHPLHVESVAWAAERKDVLSTFFWMLTMGAYAFYAARPDLKKYLITLGLFALGLMAKPMLVTLPFVLLLLDFWPLGRWSDSPAVLKRSEHSVSSVNMKKKRQKKSEKSEKIAFQNSFNQRKASTLLVEKTPFFILAALSCILTIIAQQKGGAVSSLETIPLATRLMAAFTAYGAYIQKMICPEGLALIYPYVKIIPLWTFVLSFVLFASATAFSIWVWKSYPPITFGWMWYVGTLVPVIGLIQVGEQALADRYTYIPLVGLFIMIAWGVTSLSARNIALRKAMPAAACFIVAALTTTAYLQVQHWKNDLTLFRHVSESTRDNFTAEFRLGFALSQAGQFEEACQHYSKALRIRPDSDKAHSNLGIALVNRGKTAQALEHFQSALQINPKSTEAHNNAGLVLMQMGNLGSAYAHFEESRRLKPDNPDTLYYLGALLVQTKQFVDAIRNLNDALRLNAGHAPAHNMLGIALASTGQMEEAIVQFRLALQINPDYREALNNLQRAESEKRRK